MKIFLYEEKKSGKNTCKLSLFMLTIKKSGQKIRTGKGKNTYYQTLFICQQIKYKRATEYLNSPIKL